MWYTAAGRFDIHSLQGQDGGAFTLNIITPFMLLQVQLLIMIPDPAPSLISSFSGQQGMIQEKHLLPDTPVTHRKLATESFKKKKENKHHKHKYILLSILRYI